VVVLREGDRGIETLLIQRPKTFRFASGQFVFPGGKVDPEDYGDWAEKVAPFPENFSFPPTLQYLSDGERKGVFRAVLRELLEEVGIGVGKGGIFLSPVSFKREETPEKVYRYLWERSLTLEVGALHYWVNWVTPKPVPIRFDTHFFLLPLPGELSLKPNPEEVERYIWISPREALEGSLSGKMEVMFPTYKTLEQLAKISSLKEGIRFVEEFPKIRVEPEVTLDPEGGITLALPPEWPSGSGSIP
jgi:8-oxo-dGTP pyrophosphatase MutT (NUDIX family)